MDDKVIELALNSDFKDFTTIENGMHIIITRNIKDFKTSILPVMTAAEYL